MFCYALSYHAVHEHGKAYYFDQVCLNTSIKAMLSTLYNKKKFFVWCIKVFYLFWGILGSLNLNLLSIFVHFYPSVVHFRPFESVRFLSYLHSRSS